MKVLPSQVVRDAREAARYLCEFYNDRARFPFIRLMDRRALRLAFRILSADSNPILWEFLIACFPTIEPDTPMSLFLNQCVQYLLSTDGPEEADVCAALWLQLLHPSRTVTECGRFVWFRLLLALDSDSRGHIPPIVSQDLRVLTNPDVVARQAGSPGHVSPDTRARMVLRLRDELARAIRRSGHWQCDTIFYLAERISDLSRRETCVTFPVVRDLLMGELAPLGSDGRLDGLLTDEHALIVWTKFCAAPATAEHFQLFDLIRGLVQKQLDERIPSLELHLPRCLARSIIIPLIAFW